MKKKIFMTHNKNSDLLILSKILKVKTVLSHLNAYLNKDVSSRCPDKLISAIYWMGGLRNIFISIWPVDVGIINI